jgi:hypothetical protein
MAITVFSWTTLGFRANALTGKYQIYESASRSASDTKQSDLKFQMTELIYEDFEYLSRAELQMAFDSGNSEKIRNALFSAAKYEPDWRWSQDQCFRFLDHPDHLVRWAAALALGFIALYQRNLDLPEALPRLHAACHDPLIKGPASDSIEMVLQFVKPR